jgi:23S rRNA-/tRNA-specific pseudouridylate synthase
MGVDEKTGKPCKTDFVVLKRECRFTLVHAFPVTGRRHQIRVHLYHIGHPIVGDRMYGDTTLQRRFPRLMLHAESIAFTKADGSGLVVESAATELFEKSVRDLLVAGDGIAEQEAGPTRQFPPSWDTGGISRP